MALAAPVASGNALLLAETDKSQSDTTRYLRPDFYSLNMIVELFSHDMEVIDRLFFNEFNTLKHMRRVGVYAQAVPRFVPQPPAHQ